MTSGFRCPICKVIFPPPMFYVDSHMRDEHELRLLKGGESLKLNTFTALHPRHGFGTYPREYVYKEEVAT